ncbi:MAG: hypothetical protein DDT26_01261 [Dehalococcoidia bacterium]|nr:hypothetical protein [Chloroflexota bacterium]
MRNRLLHLFHQLAGPGPGNEFILPLYLLHGLRSSRWFPVVGDGLINPILMLQEASTGGAVEGVEQHILDGPGKPPGFRFGLFQLRFKHIRRSTGNWCLSPLVALEDHPLDILVDRCRRLAIEPPAIVLYLLRDHLVRPDEDVLDRLDTHDLAGRRNQRGIAELGSYLCRHILALTQPVEGIGLFQLRNQVGGHPAGDLVNQHSHIDDRHS